MYNLNEARVKVKEQQEKMYKLTSMGPGEIQMTIFKAKYAIQHVYANMTHEDRATLMNEIYNEITRGK